MLKIQNIEMGVAASYYNFCVFIYLFYLVLSGSQQCAASLFKRLRQSGYVP